MSQNGIVSEGYCVLTNTIGTQELVWKIISDDGEWYPKVFTSEMEAHVDMMDSLMEDFRQYQDGNHKWEEIIWPVDEYEVCKIEIYEDGELTVKDKTGHIVIETTLSDWRANL